MQNLLVVTVGGSCEPIINACREFRPDVLYFICTAESEKTVDGEGDPCRDPRKNSNPTDVAKTNLNDPKNKSIVSQLKLSPQHYRKITLEDPDSLDEIYKVFETIEQEIKEKYPSIRRKAISYTGGTKTMTSGAVMFGSYNLDWELAFQKGIRTDAKAVTCGDQWYGVNTKGLHAKNQLSIYRELLKNYHYAAVDEFIRLLYQSGSNQLPQDQYKQMHQLRILCQAFDAWDKFDHKRAIELLEIAPWEEKGLWIFKGKKIINEVKRPEPYQILQDLLLNAERCQSQCRYDDAVARLYRSLELFAQIRLKTEYGIDSGDVKLEKLPIALQETYGAIYGQKKKIEITLVQDYQLLLDLNDSLGVAWKEKENKLKDVLKIRNYSIFAHGLVLIDEAKYDIFEKVIISFISDEMKKLKIEVDKRQLPTTELLNI